MTIQDTRLDQSCSGLLWAICVLALYGWISGHVLLGAHGTTLGSPTTGLAPTPIVTSLYFTLSHSPSTQVLIRSRNSRPSVSINGPASVGPVMRIPTDPSPNIVARPTPVVSCFILAPTKMSIIINAATVPSWSFITDNTLIVLSDREGANALTVLAMASLPTASIIRGCKCFSNCTLASRSLSAISLNCAVSFLASAASDCASAIRVSAVATLATASCTDALADDTVASAVFMRARSSAICWSCPFTDASADFARASASLAFWLAAATSPSAILFRLSAVSDNCLPYHHSPEIPPITNSANITVQTHSALLFFSFVNTKWAMYSPRIPTATATVDHPIAKLYLANAVASSDSVLPALP
jgi:hypothetical protein